MPKKFAYKAVAAGLLISLSGTAFAALSDQWYIGIGGGMSVLQPEASDSSVDVDDKNGQLGTIFFGKDFDSRSSGQFQLYSLGESSFDDGQSTASYVGGDASLLYRFFDSRDRRERGAVFGTSFYGRFGFGFLNRDSDLPLDDDAPVYFGVGAGLETYFTHNLGMRLEAMYHETDAASASLSLVTRFGGHRSRPPVRPPAVVPSAPVAVTPPTSNPVAEPVPAPDAIPGPASNPTPEPDVAAAPGSLPSTQPESTTASIPDISAELPPPGVTAPEQGPGSSESPLDLTALQDTADQAANAAPPSAETIYPAVEVLGNTQEIEQIEPEAPASDVSAPTIPPAANTAAIAPLLPNADSDGDGINDIRDRCPDSTPGYPVNTRGCPLYAGLLPDVTFQDGTAEFDASSFAVLDRLAQTLNEHPDSAIEIVAHTDNSGTEQQQSALTRQRLRSVGLYLVNLGISQERLLLRSFGGKRPAFDNDTADGRRRNNRIEVFENP
ncbi:OmpA family protein [Granulosicoccus sp. 3-233]|uniref:OmpA family protein n=1 Tax=Granulosicoccus sp. 3-233 TaxID=3417969 RepID=UPI003D358D3F